MRRRNNSAYRGLYNWNLISIYDASKMAIRGRPTTEEYRFYKEKIIEKGTFSTKYVNQ